MGILKKRYNCTLTEDELEVVIATAIVRAQSEIAKTEKNASKNDPLTISVRIIICTVFGLFALIFLATAGASVATIFISNIPSLESMYVFSVPLRCVLALMLAVYGIWFAVLTIAALKETNRNFLISFFSVLLSAVALLIAIYVK